MSTAADAHKEELSKEKAKSRRKTKRRRRNARKKKHSGETLTAPAPPAPVASWQVVETSGVAVEQTGFLMLEEYSGGDYQVVDGQLVLPKHARATTSALTTKTAEEAATLVSSASSASAQEVVSVSVSVSNGSSDEEKGEDEIVREHSAPAADAKEVFEGAENWQQYGLHPEILRGIARLGFKEPTEIQRLCLPRAIRDGRDVLGAAETGSGKTLAYGLPLLNSLIYDSRPETDKLQALVLTPTRELAFQVDAHLTALLGKERKGMVATVVGGMSQQKQVRILGRKPAVLVVTPGRFWALVQQGVEHLSDLQNSLRFLVVDEADRMLDKGHFPELKPLITLLKSKGNNTKKRQTFLFSATLLQSHNKDYRRKKKRKREEGVSPFLRLIQQIGVRGTPAVCSVTKEGCSGEGVHIEESNDSKMRLPAGLTLAKVECTEKSKCNYTYYFLQNYQGRTLIFVNTISTLRRVSKVFQLLQIQNLSCLHANMQQKQRLKALERFRNNKNAVLVATDVAARGLDIPDVDFVMHYGIPKSVESFIHRSGRTARAKKDGLSLALVSPQEQSSFLRIVQSLPQGQEMDKFPVDQSYMTQLKERVNVASQLEKAQRFASKALADKLWRKQNAAKAEILLESDSEPDSREQRVRGGANNESTEANIKRLQRRLKLLLRERVIPVGTSTKFVTINPFLAEDSFKESPREILTRKRNLLADARGSKRRRKQRKRR